MHPHDSGRMEPVKDMKKKKRIELIDLVKAVTIFLVILGHTTGNLETPLYRRILYSFHMPLFFFLAGLSIRPAPVKGWHGWQVFLRKNILALVVPYLIWGLIYAPFSFDRFPKLFYASWAALGAMGTLTSLWYLSALFSARILTQALISLFGTPDTDRLRTLCGYAAVPMFLIGFLLPKFYPVRNRAVGNRSGFRAGNGTETQRVVCCFPRSVLPWYGGTGRRVGVVPYVRGHIRRYLLVHAEQHFRLCAGHILLHDSGPNRQGRGETVQLMGCKVHWHTYYGHFPDSQESFVSADPPVDQKLYSRYGVFYGFSRKLRRSRNQPGIMPAH